MFSRLGSFLVLGVAALALASAPASASITVGQTGQITSSPCSGIFDLLQPTVTSGTPYTVPQDGTIDSWSTRGGSGSAALKIFRSTGAANTYRAVAHEGPHTLSTGLNTFAANVPVKGGDLIGLAMNNVPNCAFDAPGEHYFYSMGSLADGASGTFTSSPGFRVNVSASLEPPNSFTLGPPVRNRKNGTATITATVPGPGTLALSGNGVLAQQASRAGKSVSAAGSVSLLVRTAGKKARKLKRKGKVSVGVTVTFTPTSGLPNNQTTSIKLRKKIRKKP